MTAEIPPYVKLRQLANTVPHLPTPELAAALRRIADEIETEPVVIAPDVAQQLVDLLSAGPAINKNFRPPPRWAGRMVIPSLSPAWGFRLDVWSLDEGLALRLLTVDGTPIWQHVISFGPPAGD